MDNDNAIELSGDHGDATSPRMAVSEQFETPKMPSQYQPSPRVTSSRYRKEIEKVKRDIASLKNKVESLTEEIDSQHVQLTSDPSNPLASYMMQEIILNKEEQNLHTGNINLSMQRLIWLEAQVTRVEEEAEMRAKDSHKHAMRSGIGQEGPDSVYVSDVGKFRLMRTWLDTQRTLLLRSPPGSGKTSFGVRFTDYLVREGFSVTYMNASAPENQPTVENSIDNVMEQAIGDTFSQFCKAQQKPFYLIVDEAQSWYPINADERVKKQFDDFWAAVKAFVNSGMDWHRYSILRSGGLSRAEATSMSKVEVRLLCLAGYGEANLGLVSTPQVFLDPTDPVTGLRMPLGLNFLRFDREKTYELITIFTKFKESEGKLTSFANDPAVCNLIFKETNGHVGAIRCFLSHVIGAGKTTKEDIIEFTSSSRFRTELTVYRPFLSVSESSLLKLSSEDTAFLLRCIGSYKAGTHTFPGHAAAGGLIKLGLLVMADLTTLAFPSPLHFDVALHNVLRRRINLLPTRASFEAAIQEMVLRMNPKLLNNTPTGHQPFERQWEDECYYAFRAMSDTTIMKQVGREYDQHAFLDIYVKSLQWGIELIRLGGGKRLGEHVGRFSEHDGRYRGIPMKEYAVLNFTNNVPTQATLDLYDDDVWHLVYNDEYTEVTVYRKDKTEEKWDLIGAYHVRVASSSAQ